MIAFLQRHRFVMLVAAALFVLDQGTKAVVVQNLALGHSWPAEGFFRITHIANSGSAFGLLDGQNVLLTIASVLGIGVLVLFYRSHPNPGLLVRLSLGLMLAGALGNLTDRLVRGHVTDFVDIGPWYIFNVADASIVTGVIILAVTIVLPEPAAAGAPEPAPAPGAPEPAAVGEPEPAAAAEPPADDRPAS